MENYLEKFPKWLADFYNKIDPENSDEANLFAELFTLFLDEKAIAKVWKGDGLFLLNGISSKEYTYTTYDYDDEYNITEIEKTEKETVPDFLFMNSSEDSSILEKTLKYAIKKEKASYRQGIYSFEDKTFKPYSIHILFKDGIVFIGTSFEDIYKIKTNSYVSKIDKKQKKLLLRNNTSAYFNPKNLKNKLPKEKMSIHNFMKANYLIENMGIIHAQSGIKGDFVSSEYIMETGEQDENALKYLFKLIEIVND